MTLWCLKFSEEPTGLRLGSKLLLNRGKWKFWSDNFDPQLTYCVNTNSQCFYSIWKRIRMHTYITYILTLWLVCIILWLYSSLFVLYASFCNAYPRMSTSIFYLFWLLRFFWFFLQVRGKPQTISKFKRGKKWLY